MGPQEYEDPSYNFTYLKAFIANFSGTLSMSPSTIRQGFVEFAGQTQNVDDPEPIGQIIGSVLNLTDADASSNTGFVALLAGLDVMGGSTNTPAAIDYVRTQMLTEANRRPGVQRVVILGSDGYPSGPDGFFSPELANQSVVAAQALRDEDGAVFIFLRIGDDYPANWFSTIAERIYSVATFTDLNSLLQNGNQFLCLGEDIITRAPSAAPIVPSLQPTATPTLPTRQPSATPSTSRPSRTPSKTPSRSPSTAKPSTNPSRSPSRTPSTSKPSRTPSSSPTSSRPSASPSRNPSTSKPSVSPSTSRPSAQPTRSPSSTPTVPSQKPSGAPSSTPTTSRPSASPSTARPSRTPSRAPTCFVTQFADVVWVLDASSSMVAADPNFPDLRDFVSAYTERVSMGPSGIRQAFLTFSGPSVLIPNTQTINNVSALTDLPFAVSAPNFTARVSQLRALGGSTDQAGAIDFVRTTMLTPANYRPGSQRIVIFASDGGPTLPDGELEGGPDEPSGASTESAVTLLKQEDGVIFVFLRFEDPLLYPANFLRTLADYTYDTTFAALPLLLDLGFLCVPPAGPQPPPPAPLRAALNLDDAIAFAELSNALQRETWSECNRTNVDPCESCYANTEDHAIICAARIIPTDERRRRLSDGSVPRSERRIVGIRLRNVGAKGILRIDVLARMSALRELVIVDAKIKLPANTDCVDLDLCSGSPSSCTFSSSIPLCMAKASARSGSSVNAGVIAGIVVGISLLALAVGIGIVRLRRRSSAPGNSLSAFAGRKSTNKGYDEGWTVAQIDGGDSMVAYVNKSTMQFTYARPESTLDESSPPKPPFVSKDNRASDDIIVREGQAEIRDNRRTGQFSAELTSVPL